MEIPPNHKRSKHQRKGKMCLNHIFSLLVIFHLLSFYNKQDQSERYECALRRHRCVLLIICKFGIAS